MVGSVPHPPEPETLLDAPKAYVPPNPCSWFGVSGFGLGAWGLGFGVWGLGFGVWGLGFRV